MSDVTYPRIGELSTLYSGQETHLAPDLDLITSRRHPDHIAELQMRPGGITAYQFWPQMTSVNQKTNEAEWNLQHEITEGMSTRLLGVRTWERDWIDFSLTGIGTIVGTMCRNWFHAQSGYSALLLDGLVTYLWPGWIGNQELPEGFSMTAWAQGTYAFLEALDDVPIIFGGDKFSPPMGFAHGIKLEDFLWRETDFFDEVYNARDTDNRNLLQAHKLCREGSRMTICAAADRSAINTTFHVATTMLFDGIFVWPSGDPATGQARIEQLRTMFPQRWTPKGNYTRVQSPNAPAGKRDRFERVFIDENNKTHIVRVYPETREVTGL